MDMERPRVFNVLSSHCRKYLTFKVRALQNKERSILYLKSKFDLTSVTSCRFIILCKLVDSVNSPNKQNVSITKLRGLLRYQSV